MKQRYCPKCGSATVVQDGDLPIWTGDYESWLMSKSPKEYWHCLDCDCKFDDPFAKKKSTLIGGVR